MNRRLILPAAGFSTLGLLVWGYISLAPPRKTKLPPTRVLLARQLEGLHPPVGRLVGLTRGESVPMRFRADRRKPISRLVETLRQKALTLHMPWDLANLAVVELLTGDPERAVVHLESAVALNSHDARLRSDLSAAYLGRAKKLRNPLDAMRGLAAAQRAYSINPALREAGFNRAAALDLLRFSRKAKYAWEQYLSLDSTTAWANEARARVNQLEKPDEETLWHQARHKLLAASLGRDRYYVTGTVKRFSQPAHVFATEVILPGWASATAAGNRKKAEHLLILLRDIGAALAGFYRDYEIADCAAFAKRANHDSASQALLVAGYNLYAAGRKLQLRHEPQEALPLLSSAAEKLSQAGNPLAHRVKLFEIVALMDLGRIEPALDAVELLYQHMDRRRYRSLAAKAYWIRGMLLFKNSQPVLALSDFLQAIEIYRAISAWEDLCASHYLAAETLEYLGNSEEAAEHLWAALSLYSRLINRWRLFAILDELADSAQEENLNEVAVQFRDEVVRLLNHSDDAVGLAHALLRRAETLVALNQSLRSLENLEAAHATAAKINDQVERDRITSAIFLATGESWLLKDPRQSLTFLEKALRFYSATGDQFELPRVYQAAHSAYQALGDGRRADRATANAIAWYEGQDASADVDYGPLFAARLDHFYNNAIMREIHNGNIVDALRYAERRRIVAGMIFESSPDPRRLSEQAAQLSFDELRTILPADVCLIIYTMLPERLAVWTVDHQKVRFRSLSTSQLDLSSLVEAYYKSLEDGQAVALRRELLAQLHDKLLAVVLTDVRRDMQLVIVPSGILSRVPFSAALNRRTGRYLIQDFPVSVCPSVLGMLRSNALRKRRSKPAVPSVLAIGAPKLDRQILPNVPDLPFAGAEALRIFKLYQRGCLLRGEHATKLRVLREMPHFSVVHIGAHAIANERFPGRSLVALGAGGGKDGGLVRPREIAGLNLSSVDLLVLGVCRAATGERDSESQNLVAPFLNAGVASVIASLWDIDDSFSSRFLPLVHEGIAGRRNPTDALRSAQLSALNSRNTSDKDPGNWATYAVFGRNNWE